MTESRTSTLCPGYKHVDKFSEPDLYEDDEDEIEYVVLDLGSQAEPSLLSTSRTYRLLGLDTATPMVQLRGTLFRGSVQPLIGSELLFRDAPRIHASTEEDDEFMPHSNLLEPHTTVSQHLSFRQVTLKPKSDSSHTHGTIHPLPNSRLKAVERAGHYHNRGRINDNDADPWDIKLLVGTGEQRQSGGALTADAEPSENASMDVAAGTGIEGENALTGDSAPVSSVEGSG